jgi:hypothetical protein
MGRLRSRKEWCERGESNPHGLPRQILSLVRLPVPPLSHGLNICRDAACRVSHSNAASHGNPPFADQPGHRH